MQHMQGPGQIRDIGRRNLARDEPRDVIDSIFLLQRDLLSLRAGSRRRPNGDRGRTIFRFAALGRSDGNGQSVRRNLARDRTIVVRDAVTCRSNEDGGVRWVSGRALDSWVNGPGGIEMFPHLLDAVQGLFIRRSHATSGEAQRD